MPNIAEQVINDAKEAQTKYKLPILNQNQEALLKQQILDTNKSDHKVKSIVSKCLIVFILCIFLFRLFSFLEQRVKDFFLDIIESSTANPQKVPSGLTALQKNSQKLLDNFFVLFHTTIQFLAFIIIILWQKPCHSHNLCKTDSLKYINQYITY